MDNSSPKTPEPEGGPWIGKRVAAQLLGCTIWWITKLSSPAWGRVRRHPHQKGVVSEPDVLLYKSGKRSPVQLPPRQKPPEDIWLPVRNVSVRVGVPERRLYKLAARGKIRSLKKKSGGRLRTHLLLEDIHTLSDRAQRNLQLEGRGAFAPSEESPAPPPSNSPPNLPPSPPASRSLSQIRDEAAAVRLLVQRGRLAADREIEMLYDILGI